MFMFHSTILYIILYHMYLHLFFLLGHCIFELMQTFNRAVYQNLPILLSVSPTLFSGAYSSFLVHQYVQLKVCQCRVSIVTIQYVEASQIDSQSVNLMKCIIVLPSCRSLNLKLWFDKTLFTRLLLMVFKEFKPCIRSCLDVGRIHKQTPKLVEFFLSGTPTKPSSNSTL